MSSDRNSDTFYGGAQRFRLNLAADGDAQVIPNTRVVEPANKDSLFAQHLEPDLRRRSRRPNEDKIRLARMHLETQLLKLTA